MTAIMARLLIALYPRAWRERYGAEFEALLEDGRGGMGAWTDVVRSAILERISPTQGGKVNQPSYSLGAVMRQPSAFIPVGMSLSALALVVGHIAFYGAAREADEGTTAHLWQILMAGQLPVLVFFAAKWLRRAPWQALGVLTMQAGAVLAAMAPVFYFNL
jgi:hypothetical protein